jgi:hypothetical protein
MSSTLTAYRCPHGRSIGSRTDHPCPPGLDACTVGPDVVPHGITPTSTCVAPFLYVAPVIRRTPAPLPAVGPTTYTVEFHWTSTAGQLDRPHTHSVSAGSDLRLAQRLCAATIAGRIQSDARILVDIYDHTYVISRCAVLGKYLNADLTELGF